MDLIYPLVRRSERTTATESSRPPGYFNRHDGLWGKLCSSQGSCYRTHRLGQFGNCTTVGIVPSILNNNPSPLEDPKSCTVYFKRILVQLLCMHAIRCDALLACLCAHGRMKFAVHLLLGLQNQKSSPRRSRSMAAVGISSVPSTTWSSFWWMALLLGETK
jgi:hypothetical protein